MSISKKLLEIQIKLNAPKGQYNSFGKYKYRSCEDILEAVKPLLKEQKAVLLLTDEVVQIGERYYIKANATLKDCETDEEISNEAVAREEQEKKGMDASQVTGTASSYARKYALNGLFCIDDANDADTDYREQTTPKTATPKQVEILSTVYKGENLAKLLNKYEIENLQGLPLDVASEILGKLQRKEN